MSNQLLEVLTQASEVEPIIEINGRPLHTFADAVLLNEVELLNKKAGFKEVELADRELNPSQDSYKRVNKKYAAVDPNALFNNRYKKTVSKPGGKPTAYYTVVVDYKALQFQQTGQVNDNVQAFEIKVTKDESGKLATELSRIVQLSGEEFVNEYTRALSPKDMRVILPLIHNKKIGRAISTDTLSIN